MISHVVSRFSGILPYIAGALIPLGLIFLFQHCNARRPVVPVNTVRFAGPHGPGATLIVLLPGRGGTLKDFTHAGFIEMARNSGYEADMVGVNLFESYYYNHTVIERLHQDVLAAETRPVWLVGVSLGGLGSVLYALQHPRNIAGILLIAPYLGEPPILREMEAAGGTNRWNPIASSSGQSYEAVLWRWLKEGHSSIPLYLAYGTDDRMADAHRLLSGILPQDHVITMPGGHDWSTWKALWAEVLKRKILPIR